jgi:rubrerythrin
MLETEVLDRAIEAEKVSLITYLGLALATSDPSGKDMFLRLAIDEFSHMRILEEQRSGLCDSGCWREVDVERSEIEELVPKLDDADLKVKGTSGMDQIDALRVALKAEEEALEYYSTHAREAEDESAKKMFRRLAETEEAHRQLIQAEMDYIQGTGDWFEVRKYPQE